MKRFFCGILVGLLIFSLAGCSIDTYTPNSDSTEFELANVVSVTLSGPSNTDISGTAVTLTETANAADFAILMDCIKGEKVKTCPTNDFVIGKITFTFTSGDQTTVYPANDGSNWFCLYSLNPSLASYIEVKPEQMKKVRELMKRHGIETAW